ncbi:MAG TPA: porin [Gemmatimonadales bacterium]|nr:porin [Gemmatimonadales bacterium]
MRLVPWGRAAAALVMVGAVAGRVRPVAAQQDTTAPSVDRRIRDLDQEIRILKRLRELEQDSLTAAAKDRPKLVADKTGFWLRSADGKFALHLGGYIQADSRTFLDDKVVPLTNTFLVRRARALIEGTVFKYFDFRLLPDWGGGTAVIQDGYIAARVSPAFRLQAGKFKGPVGLERLQSATDILFIERAFPTAIAPNRDLGFELTGDVADTVVHYDIGIFDGALDGASLDTDTGDNKDAEGRLLLTPFKHSTIAALKGLSVGVGGTIGNEHGSQAAPALSSYKTPGQNTFFSYRSDTSAVAAVANGRRWRVSPQAYWHLGPLGVLGEWIRSSQVVSRGATTATIGAKAWQAAGSFTLTGEDAGYRGVSPKKPVTTKGGFGAVELVARYSELKVDDDAFPTFANPARSARKAREWAFGVNWYPERRMKFAINYGQTSFDGGAAGGADREDENTLLTRFQVAF